MEIYRIRKRQASKYKYFSQASNWPNWKGCWHRRGVWGKSGVFFKKRETIEKHLRNLCYDWRTDLIYDKFNRYAGSTQKIIAGPFWERLDELEVDILMVLDSETIKQPAKDFMGVLEDA